MCDIVQKGRYFDSWKPPRHVSVCSPSLTDKKLRCLANFYVCPFSWHRTFDGATPSVWPCYRLKRPERVPPTPHPSARDGSLLPALPSPARAHLTLSSGHCLEQISSGPRGRPGSPNPPFATQILHHMFIFHARLNLKTSYLTAKLMCPPPEV